MTGKHEMKGTRVGRQHKNDLDTPTFINLPRDLNAYSYHVRTQPVILAALYKRQHVRFRYDAAYLLESLHDRCSCCSRHSTVNRFDCSVRYTVLASRDGSPIV